MVFVVQAMVEPFQLVSPFMVFIPARERHGSQVKYQTTHQFFNSHIHTVADISIPGFCVPLWDLVNGVKQGAAFLPAFYR